MSRELDWRTFLADPEDHRVRCQCDGAIGRCMGKARYTGHAILDGRAADLYVCEVYPKHRFAVTSTRPGIGLSAVLPAKPEFGGSR